MRNIRLSLSSLVALLVLSLLGSCYTYSPVAYGYSKYDRNKRVRVERAGYVKKKTGWGVSFGIGLMGLGGYVGHNLAPFKEQKSDGSSPMAAANIAAGALVGAGISFLTDIIVGRNKVRPVPMGDKKWIERVNPNYKLLSGNDSEFTLIHSNGDRSFDPSSAYDLLDFKQAYPNSPRENAVLKEGLPYVKREELPSVISAYASNPNIHQAKATYIERSRNFTELLEARNRYSDIDYDYEQNGVRRVSTMAEVHLYYKTFPQSQYASELFGFVRKQIPSRDLNQLIYMAPEHTDKSLLQESKVDYILSYPLAELKKAHSEYPDISAAEIMEKLYLQSRVTSIDSLKTLNEKFGYVAGGTEKIVAEIAHNTSIEDYGKLLQAISTLSNEVLLPIQKAYFDLQKKEYQEAMAQETEWSKHRALTKFIDKYSQYSHDAALMSEVHKYKDYYYCRGSSSSVSECAIFVKRYPQYFKEMDEHVFQKISSSPRPNTISAYKEHWPKGAYGKELDKLWDRAIRLQELDELKDIKAAQQRAAEEQRQVTRKIEEQIESEKRRVCYSCRGSGKCSSCKGTGLTSYGNICSRCSHREGSGVCSSCQGTGKIY